MCSSDLEVSPAGALRHWGIDVGDYKARGARETRERIVRNILESLRFASDPQLVVSLALTDHGTDALVAALVGRAFARGTSFRPAEDEAALAQIEGWIHMPMGALGELGSDPAATPRE